VNVTKTYDNLNRLTGETGSGTGAAAASRTFGYDTGGRMTSVGGQTMSYDTRNNLTGATGPQGASTYTYDTANRITSRTDAAGSSTFTWSPRSELKTTATNATTTSYNWLPSGELDTISYPGGTGRKYTYDDLGRSLTDTVTAAGAGGGTTVGSNGTVTAPVFAEGFSAAWWGYAVDDVASGGNPGRMLSRPNSVPGDGVVVSTGVVTTAFTTVSFDVKGAVDVGVYANSDGQAYTTPASRKVTPSATWTRYTCSFAPRSLTATWNQIRFYPLTTAGTISIDNVEIGNGTQPVDTCQLATSGGVPVAPTVGSIGTVTAPVFAEGFSAAWWGYAVDDVASGGNPGRMLSRPNSVQGDGVVVSTGVVTAFTTVSFDVKGAVDVGVYANSDGQAYTTPASRKVTPSATAWTRYTCSFGPRPLTATWNQIRFFPYSAAGTVSVDNVEVGNGTQPVDTCQLANTGSPGGGGGGSGGGVVLSSRVYTYNADSTVASSTVSQAGNTAAGVYTYAYDRGARLRSTTFGAATTAYTYDAAGNRLTSGANSFVYDARNRLTAGTGTAYSWSARGTLTGTTGVGAAAYSFDGLDRMTSAGAVAYAYDSLDRVTTRTVAGVATVFSYAGVEMDPVAEGTTTKYLRGPSGQSVHGIIRNGVLSFAGADRHGDVSFSLSTTGAVTDSKISDPFGKTLGATGTGTNVGFQSDWTDPTNGLVWMGARWYNPQTATFTSRDTYPGSVGAYATLNRYTYGLNNPLKYTDPTGHRVCGDNDPDCQVHVNGNEVYGNGNTVVGGFNFVDGNNNTVNGNGNSVVGESNTVVGSGNLVVGHFNEVVGHDNVIRGGEFNHVLGSGNSLVASNYNIIIGGGNSLRDSNTNFVSGFQNILVDSDRNRIAGDWMTLQRSNDNTVVWSGLDVVDKSGVVLYGGDLKLAATRVNVLNRFFFGGNFDRDMLMNNWWAGGTWWESSSCVGVGACMKAWQQANYDSSEGSLLAAKLIAMSYCHTNTVSCGLTEIAGQAFDGAVMAALLFAGVGLGSCHSFRADTTVLMDDGETKKISEIVIGDKVRTTDPKTGVTVVREVTAVHVNRDSDLADLIVGDGEGRLSTIHTTQHHRFWDETRNGWVDAVELVAGERLHGVSGEVVTVEGVKTWTGLQTMYDLTVEGVHTYYVETGSTGVLVHNCDPLETQVKGKTPRLTNPQATDLAEYNGYSDTGIVGPKGQKIFTNGKQYISQDVDSHNGGIWKIARSPKALNSKNTRTATTDALLTPIKR
jgi:RHS repeat-associated protein